MASSKRKDDSRFVFCETGRQAKKITLELAQEGELIGLKGGKERKIK